ncbi:FKBP-type peptidyl-prolyl cis-trans isomerase [Parapedobacter deserti]|uniref:Peptidyl-prolyl cis-trans isomerase n=1 Tax=Parapedobacter deserti TaxID=1912957 RepID=A0ABV7JI38_9SPHI
MKFSYVVAGVSLLLNTGLASAQQVVGGRGATLTSRADSVAYAFGASIARDLKQAGVAEVNAVVLAAAITDLFAGKESILDDGQERELIMGTITEARERMNAQLKDAAHAFMEENKARQGIVTTATGLQYEVIREGAGDRPTTDDTVTVHYKGKLSDGKMFDSSYDRGEPATFPLGRVIQGWQEGLQLMRSGAHYRIYVPYGLGYGERGMGQDIPPYSPLIFDVELISIQKAVREPAEPGQLEEAK